jgi:hypothetical protein
MSTSAIFFTYGTAFKPDTKPQTKLFSRRERKLFGMDEVATKDQEVKHTITLTMQYPFTCTTDSSSTNGIQ